MTGSLRIGLDFDNTLILYDRVFAGIGQSMGLLPPGFSGTKVEVRAWVRALPDGEAKWTLLQAKVYGPGIEQAVPSPGLWEFLDRCRTEDADVFVVSHKTETAAADPAGTNLRIAARRWIDERGLTAPGRGGIRPERVFFEATRREKIARIAALGCTHFVDDLAELFLEDGFPAGTGRHLLLHGSETLPSGPFHAHQSWTEVGDAIFGTMGHAP